MKAVFAALGLLAVGSTAASAQFAPHPYDRGRYPYEERHHAYCERRAWELHQIDLEIRAGHSNHKQRMAYIQAVEDLKLRCGGFRYRD